MDLAASIQVVAEKLIVGICQYAKKLTGSNQLCLAGGVALNCVANGKLLRSGLFDKIWIQPASGDAGGSAWRRFIRLLSAPESRKRHCLWIRWKDPYSVRAIHQMRSKKLLNTTGLSSNAIPRKMNSSKRQSRTSPKAKQVPRPHGIRPRAVSAKISLATRDSTICNPD